MKNKLINYADYQYSYVHALEPKLKTLAYYAYYTNKPVSYLFKTIMNILEDSDTIYTKKEKEFIKDLRNCSKSSEIYWRVRNAVDYTRKNVFVWVDERGELV